jgi:hypothetical protein
MKHDGLAMRQDGRRRGTRRQRDAKIERAGFTEPDRIQADIGGKSISAKRAVRASAAAGVRSASHNNGVVLDSHLPITPDLYQVAAHSQFVWLMVSSHSHKPGTNPVVQ